MGVVSQLIGIGIGIELTDPVFPKLLADRVATLSELRQISHTAIEQWLLLPAVVCGHRIAHRQHVLKRSALQRRAACDFKRPASVPRSSLCLYPRPLTLNSLQRDRLLCAQQLILRVAVARQLVARPAGPTDIGDGRSASVKLLVAECHRAFSLSIQIPIATQTPIALRQRMDRVGRVINEPVLSARGGGYSGWWGSRRPSALRRLPACGGRKPRGIVSQNSTES